MTTLSERLLARMDSLTMKPAELARRAGVRPPTAHFWLSGRTKEIKAEPLAKAAQALGVNVTWLRTGAGPMLLAPLPTAQELEESSYSRSLAQILAAVPESRRQEAFTKATTVLSSYLSAATAPEPAPAAIAAPVAQTPAAKRSGKSQSA